MSDWKEAIFPSDEKEYKRRRKAKKMFLDENIFQGCENCNTGFDVPGIKYFSKEDFNLIMKRCEELNIGICGIEPWPNGDFGGVKVCEEYNKEPTDKAWYLKAFEEFLDEGIDHNFAASYDVPESIIEKYLKQIDE